MIERQREMFDDWRAAGRADRPPPLWLQKRRHHWTVSVEQVFVLGIVVLLGIVTSYVVGVEQGRRAIPRPVAQVAPVTPPSPAAQPIAAITVVKLPRKVFYTIQVVSMTQRGQADIEAERLQKEGFQTMVRLSGKFFIVLVGQFPQREQALAVMRQLKRRYKDCFIRKEVVDAHESA